MALKLAFLNQKGGCGKTSCTALCANAFSNEPFGYNLAVLDVDSQHSLVKLRSFEDHDSYKYPIHELTAKSFLNQIPNLNDQYDLILIDAAGKLDSDLSLVLDYVDFVFVPFWPGAFSLDATLEFIDYVEALDGPKVFAFLNGHQERLKAHQFIANEFVGAKEIYENIQFMRTRLRRSTIFENLDTYTSFYDENSSHPAKLNFTIWLSELNKLITA